MGKKATAAEDFLALVPVKNERIEWQLDESGYVQLVAKRNRRFEKIVCKFFKAPDTATISLDAMGSVVWRAIDNQRDIGMIGEILKNEFNETAEPLQERLGGYINILRNNRFIELKHVN
ncbi:MAG: PqqD family protein [Clostridia bacterium]|nr:PqqD family protein [Clostridia bacterium]